MLVSAYGLAALFVYVVFKGLIAPELSTQYLAGAVLLTLVRIANKTR